MIKFASVTKRTFAMLFESETRRLPFLMWGFRHPPFSVPASWPLGINKRLRQGALGPLGTDHRFCIDHLGFGLQPHLQAVAHHHHFMKSGIKMESITQ